MMQTAISSTRALKILAVASTFATVVFGASAASSQEFVYAAKYVCGRSVIPPNQAAPPVVPGTYRTAINVLNAGPSDALLQFRKRFVIALPDEKQGGFISQWFPASLKLDEAFEIDCADILKHLSQPAPVFAKGFVIIHSSQPLVIVGVYTAGATPSGPVASIAVEHVPKRP